MPLGIDLGSRFVKIVQTPDFQSFRKVRMDTVAFLTHRLEHKGRVSQPRLALEDLGLAPERPWVVTGYGKHLLGRQIKAVTEIRAHFRGACFQTGLSDFILVELGGQDSKVLLIQGKKVMDFQTNDKCAAGTGRYLENMARLLNLSLPRLARESRHPVVINNTCAIFGESEIIGLLMDRVPIQRICAGINDSVARRILQMIRRYPELPLVLAGGVALNQGVRTLLTERYQRTVLLPEDPQFNGALGCCLEELSMEEIYQLSARKEKKGTVKG